MSDKNFEITGLDANYNEVKEEISFKKQYALIRSSDHDYGVDMEMKIFDNIDEAKKKHDIDCWGDAFLISGYDLKEEDLYESSGSFTTASNIIRK